MNEAPFRFRLRSVLRVAKIHEEEGQRVMAAEATAEQAAQAHHEQCAEAYAACVAATAGADYAAVAADDFKVRAATAALRAEALRSAQVESHAAGQRVAAARDEVIARVSRRRSLEELEARHRSLHAVNAGRAAQRALDDLAQTRIRSR